MQEKKLVMVLDWPHRIERATKEPLSHGGGQLLKAIINRMSIQRGQWVHAYCYNGSKESLPSKKKERRLVMAPDLKRLDSFIKLQRPCVVIGLGKVPCEVLIDASILSMRAGTCWPSDKYGKVWITHSPDSALFDPVLTVGIYGVIAKAAEAAGISIKFNPKSRMFDWRPFMVYNRRKTYAVKNE
jgi:hypothetical protein